MVDSGLNEAGVQDPLIGKTPVCKPTFSEAKEGLLEAIKSTRKDADWLEKRSNKCCKSCTGCCWGPTMKVGGCMRAYLPSTFIVIFLMLLGFGASLVALAYLAWSQPNDPTPYICVLGTMAFLLYRALDLWRNIRAVDIEKLYKHQEVLRRCIAYRNANPGVEGFEDVEVLLVHVEEYIQKFEGTMCA